MKKSIFTLCSALLFALTSWAQNNSDTLILTIGTQDIYNVAGVSYISTVNLGSSTLPSFAPQANGLWNLSNLVYDSSFNTTRLNGPSPYSYSDTVFTSFKKLTYHYLDLNYISVPSPTGGGIFTTGIEVDTQSYHNSGLGLYANFNTATSIIGQRRTILPLPVTDSDHYATTASLIKINFVLVDTPLLGLSTVHDTLYRNYSELDTVVSYGRMILSKSAPATPSTGNDTIAVLQVRKRYTEVDSIYFKGITPLSQPGYNAIMDTLGFKKTIIAGSNGSDSATYSQRDTLSKYEDVFYRKGTITPLVKITYKSSRFDTVARVEVNTQGLFPASVNSITNTGNVTVYPNPVISNQFFIDIANAASEKWSYQLINLSGQVINSNVIASNNGTIHMAVSIASNIPAGIYYLRIMNNDNTYSVKPLQIIK